MAQTLVRMWKSNYATTSMKIIAKCSKSEILEPDEVHLSYSLGVWGTVGGDWRFPNRGVPMEAVIVVL